MSSSIKQIETLFESVSVYKSIFICKPNELNKIYKTLIMKDFPICKIPEVFKFNDHLSRILLIDENDVTNSLLLNNSVCFNEVNLVVCIKNKNVIKHLRYVPHIFL
jgi:hypothetical protein